MIISPPQTPSADIHETTPQPTRERWSTARVAGLSAASVTAATLLLGGSVFLAALAAALILISVVLAGLLI